MPGKKIAPAPSKAQKKATDSGNPLFKPTQKDYSIGNDLKPRRNLTRFVRWPKNIRIQRQRKILKLRLKVPPAINQFNSALDVNTASNLLKLLNKYRPENRSEKRKRLEGVAKDQTKGKAGASKGPISLHHGLNHVTSLIEKKTAKLVVVAHDVEPIELVVSIPALCRKMNIPYCIIKSKSRLGTLTNRKTTTVVALSEIRDEDTAALKNMITAIKAKFNDKFEEHRKQWGGGIMSSKSVKKQKARRAVEEAQAAAKAIVQGNPKDE